jgi:hypothetical protein
MKSITDMGDYQTTVHNGYGLSSSHMQYSLTCHNCGHIFLDFPEAVLPPFYHEKLFHVSSCPMMAVCLCRLLGNSLSFSVGRESTAMFTHIPSGSPHGIHNGRVCSQTPWQLTSTVKERERERVWVAFVKVLALRRALVPPMSQLSCNFDSCWCQTPVKKVRVYVGPSEWILQDSLHIRTKIDKTVLCFIS